MVRPRQTSDEWLLACAEQALVADGPHRWTLAGAAARAGVSAATYVNRFGSKDEVVRALSRRWIASISPGIAAAVAGSPPGHQQVLTATLWGFADLDDADRAGLHLSALAGDLVDPQLRDLLGEGWALVQKEVAALVATAHRAGELLAGPAPVRAARMLTSLANGTSLDWSVRPQGRLLTRLREDVGSLLDTWGTA